MSNVARRLSEDGRDVGADDIVLRFSRGDIGRKQAMEALDIDYGSLLDMLAERRLPLPELPQEQIDRMADDVVRLLEAALGSRLWCSPIAARGTSDAGSSLSPRRRPGSSHAPDGSPSERAGGTAALDPGSAPPG